MYLNHAMSPAANLRASTPTPSLPPTLPVDLENHLNSGQESTVEIWVVRHGETVENTTRTIAGQNASTLTPLGMKQAELVAKRLQGINFAVIYPSPEP
jgi:hypothetical protein